MLHASAATRGKNIKLDRGAVTTGVLQLYQGVMQCNGLLLPCDDISRPQDVEMTIGKGLFQIEAH
jgi:hypothetical protein